MDRIDWQTPSANELALMQSPAIARRILVIDLEATCEDGDSLAPEDMEIIEIGAVWATTEGSVINTFQAFVRPVLCQQLSAFCRQLTGIEQANVDGAQLFPTIAAALTSFAQRYQAPDAIWGSWGQFDATQFARDCRRHQVRGKPRGLARGRERGHRRRSNWLIFCYEYQVKIKSKYTMPSVAKIAI